MLVLTRYAGESVGGITFTMKVEQNRDGRIKFAFDAPREVSITRQELIGTGREVPRDRGIRWGER